MYRFATRLAVATSLVAAVATAHAAPSITFFDDFSPQLGAWSVTNFNSGDAGILGQLDGGSATLTLASPGSGTGTLDFDLLGFRTVDGINCCTDTFHLSINGTEIFTGNFSMGGGGSESIPLNANGATVTGSGGSRHISVAIGLIEGSNTLVFDYGAMQGFGDEAWGLDNVGVSATNLTAAVPEPETYAMMMAGLGLMGVLARRRQRGA